MYYPRIRELREDRDMTQTEIAQILHITQRAYSRYETGEREIPLTSLCTLADFHTVSVDFLLGRTNIKTPYPSPTTSKSI